VEETSPGIYLVSGDYLPIQIIETRKLSEHENLWLKSLTEGDLQVSSAGSILDEGLKRGDKAQLDAYLEVLLKANPKAFLEAKNMAKRRRETFEEVFTRAGLIPEWIERGREQGLEQGLEVAARNALAQGASLDFVQKITGLDIKTINQLAMNNV
jgi:hypothetical protein